jgi:hypothetical protein
MDSFNTTSSGKQHLCCYQGRQPCRRKDRIRGKGSLILLRMESLYRIRKRSVIVVELVSDKVSCIDL